MKEYKFIREDRDKKGNPIMRWREVFIPTSKYTPHQGAKEGARRLNEK